MFNKYLQKKNNKIIFVDPNYDISKSFSNLEKQIFVIKRKFGEKNSFTETNSLIANELENIQ